MQCLIVLLVATSATPAPAGAATDSDLSLTFETSDDGSTSGALTNRGTADLQVSRVRTDPDLLPLTKGRTRGDTALRFPKYSETSVDEGVVIVRPVGAGDPLSPGSGEFRFGASIRLDSKSQGSARDDGNNVIQRGLFRDADQYKIQIDHRRPSCRVRGSRGAVTVTADRRVRTQRWFRITCARDGTAVTLRLTRFSSGRTWTWRATGPIGTVSFADSSTPLSIGGKVTGSGGLVSGDVDQFNGKIDNPFFDR